MQCPKYSFEINDLLRSTYCQNCTENCGHARWKTPSLFQNGSSKGVSDDLLTPQRRSNYKPTMFDCPFCIQEGIKGSVWFNEAAQLFECLNLNHQAKGKILDELKIRVQVIGATRDNSPVSSEDDSRPELINPMLLSVKMFLADVRSWRRQYREDEYVCSDFSQEVVNRATERGMRCGYVVLSFEKSPVGHAIVSFETDYGLIYVEPQNGEQVDVVINRPYGARAKGFSDCNIIRSIEISWNDGTVTNL